MSSSKLAFLRHGYAMAVGTAAGVTSGLVGWGGAQVTIPSMSHPGLLASYSQLAATGISLTSLSLSSVSSGYRFWMDGRVDVPLALGIGLPALASARVGSQIAKRLSGNALQLFFNGFSLLLIPTHFWIQQQRSSNSSKCVDTNSVTGDQGKDAPPGQLESDTSRLSAKRREPAIESRADCNTDDLDFRQPKNVVAAIQSNPLIFRHASFGLFSGVLSSLMGVGGLPLTISYLTVSTELSHHEIQGTAVVALLPSILMSAASRMSVVPPSTAACVAAGAFGGGLVGAKLALSLSEEQLRYLFMGSLCLFGGINMAGAVRNIRQICSKRF